MYGEWTTGKMKRKDKAEMAKEYHRIWEWPAEAWIQGEQCECKSPTMKNFYKVGWAGEYLAVDWHVQRRISFTCQACRSTKTFWQRLPNEGEQPDNTVHMDFIMP